MEQRKSDTEIIQLRADIKELNNKVDELAEQVAGLVDLWHSATGFVKVVKAIGTFSIWLSAVLGALAAAVKFFPK